MSKCGVSAVVLNLLVSGGALAEPTICTNLSVIDPHDGSVQTGQAVVVENGLIQNVVPAATAPSGIIVDASGKFVVPGYNDMHAHSLFPPGGDPNTGSAYTEDAQTAQEAYWSLLLANGVTGFRQMSGSAKILEYGRAVKARIESGELIAPEVLQSTGEIYTGQGGTADAAREFVRTQAKDGADLFKITGGPRDGILAAMDEADGLRLDVAGHLPGSLSTQEAIAAGWDTFEHLGSGLDNILDYSPAAPQIRE